MKKVILLIFMMFGIVEASVGQVSIVASGMSVIGDSYRQTIIRERSPSEVITCEVGETVTSFSCETLSLTYRQTVAISAIVVRDFRVWNDMVVFCGQEVVSKRGIVGYFPCSEFDVTPPPPFQYTYFHVGAAAGHYLRDIQRLEVYTSPSGVPHIVAFGYDSINLGGGYLQQYLIDCKDFMAGFSTGNLHYELMALNRTATPGIEQPSDLCYTGKYVVVAGYLGGVMQHGLTLRRCDPDVPLHGDGEALFYSIETDTLVGYPEIRISAIGEETVAVAYRGRLVSPAGVDYSRLRVFDVGVMANAGSQQWMPGGKVYMHELIYMAVDNSIVLLDDALVGDVYSSAFRYLDPYATASYPSTYLCDPDHCYSSLTRLGSQHFVGSGSLHWLYRDKMAPLPAYNSYPTTPTYCPANGQQKVEMVKKVEVYKYTPPLYLYNHIEMQRPGGGTIMQMTIIPNCISN